MTDRGMSFAPQRVAVLLTDIEGSTRLWQDHAAVMPVVLMAHHRAVAEVVAEQGGRLPPDQGEGDARLAVFTGDGAEGVAVRTALALQERFAGLELPSEVRLHVRMAVDAGEVVEFEGNVFGTVVNRCARLRGLGHGGQVLVSHDVAAACNGMSLVDLGEHRLRDVAEPVRVFQAERRGIHTDFPPLLGVLAAPVVLPEPDGAILGRDAELASLAALVRERRFVTLTGTGGSGKTTLAVQTARGLVPEFSGGVYFVDLVPVGSVDDVGVTVATVMGVIDQHEDPWTAVAGAVESRRALVVLDNCEDFADLSDVLSTRARAALGRLNVLATSRRPIGIEHEVVVPLAPLATPSADVHGRSGLEASPAGMLLLARALEARPGLVVNDETSGLLAAIARRLDGMPLAMELAAARLRMQSVASLQASLEQSLIGLDDITGRHAERHRALNGVLAWSVEHLDDESRDLLTILSVFAASPDLAAVAGVARRSEAEVLAPLSRLLDTSLARAVELDDGAPRFTLLVPVREHVRSATPADVASELADRHAHYFLAWARDGSRTRYNTDRDHEWRTEAHAVRGDALAALDRWESLDPAVALEMAVHLAVLWWDLGENVRGDETLRRLVAATSDEADPYRTVARFYLWLTGERTSAIEGIYDRAVELDQPELAAYVALRWASYSARQGRDDLAAGLRAQARENLDRAQSRAARGVLALDGLTRADLTERFFASSEAEEHMWRDPARARAIAARAFAACTGPFDPAFRADGTTYAEMLAECGHVEEARRIIHQLDLGPPGANAMPFVARGLLLAREGRHDEAMQSLGDALKVTMYVNERAQISSLAADVLLLEGRPAEALSLLAGAEHLATTAVIRAMATTRLARARLAAGDVAESTRLLDVIGPEALRTHASPGALTYLLTRAMLTKGDRRRAWLQEYDDRVAATGVLPWPRDAADRAALADDA